jgi:hypothetical protein
VHVGACGGVKFDQADDQALLADDQTLLWHVFGMIDKDGGELQMGIKENSLKYNPDWRQYMVISLPHTKQ